MLPRFLMFLYAPPKIFVKIRSFYKQILAWPYSPYILRKFYAPDIEGDGLGNTSFYNGFFWH